MESFLDRLHGKARANPAFQRLAIISRILLALAFIPTGLVKLLGERFTALGVDTPVGFFFEAFYQSGMYWNFIGASQVIAGLLILIPRTATVGAFVFFPIVLNIFVITVSVGFKGTPFITGPMVLACLFLLCWDYDRWKGILFPARRELAPRQPLSRLEQAGYITGTAAGLGVFLWTRGFVPAPFVPVLLAVGVIAMLMVLTAWVRAMRVRPPTGARTAPLA